MVIVIAAILVLMAGVFYAAMVVSGMQDDEWPMDEGGTYDQCFKSNHPDYCPAADPVCTDSRHGLGGVHMISVLHLLWLVPLSMSCGAFCMAIIVVGTSMTNKQKKTLSD